MALTYYATLIEAQAAKVAAGGVGDIAWAGLTNKSKPFSLATGEDMAQVNIDADRASIKAYNKFTALVAMNPAQVSTWVDNNVTTLAQAQDAIKTLAIICSYLGRSIL